MSRTYRRKNYNVNDYLAYTEEDFNYFKNTKITKPECIVKHPVWDSHIPLSTALSIVAVIGEKSDLAKQIKEYYETFNQFMEFHRSNEQSRWRRFCRFNNHVRNSKTYEEYIQFTKKLCHSDSWNTWKDYESLNGRRYNRKLRRLHKNSIRKLSIDPDGDWVDVELVPCNKDITVTKFPNINELFE